MQSIDQRLSSGWHVSGDRSSSTIVREDGLKSTAGFLDTPTGRIFTVLHQSAAPARSAVVICPPVYAEAVRNQRRELALSWELSAVGIASARFHYLGSGHSDGDAERLSFEQMVEDAIKVGRHLQNRLELSNVGFVGTRIGALVASSAAREFAGSPLVLWEPSLDIGRYYNELFKARMIGLLKRGQKGQSTRDLMTHFAADGFLDVVGSPVAHSLYASTTGLDATDLIIKAGQRPILTIQMSVKSEIRPQLADLVETCRQNGIEVRTDVVEYDEAWWFGASGYTVVAVESGALEAIPITTAFVESQI